MATITLDNSSLKKYIDLLRKLDVKSRKKIVSELTDSIKESEDEKKDNDFFSLFGSWNDKRDPDEIIKEIRDSRINNRDIETF
ncbi:hypothetical protein [Flavobacterium sp.]|uniref:hypothetical protein n=1 Tax=Flavobacterium sp. TaxID=239 RepID=UPI0040342D44